MEKKRIFQDKMLLNILFLLTGIPHFMANREKVETVTDFIFLGSKITADGLKP